MKTLLWLSVMLTGAALGAPALMTKTRVTDLAVCKSLGCREVRRYVAVDDIMGRFVHVLYSTSPGYDLQGNYALTGELTGLEINLRRNPLDENDKAVILRLVENVTGSRYTKGLVEQCFAKAGTTAKFGDYFSGQTFMAGGQTPVGAPWALGCWTFIKNSGVVNRVYVTFAFQ